MIITEFNILSIWRSVSVQRSSLSLSWSKDPLGKFFPFANQKCRHHLWCLHSLLDDYKLHLRTHCKWKFTFRKEQKNKEGEQKHETLFVSQPNGGELVNCAFLLELLVDLSVAILCNIIVANCFLTKAICLHWKSYSDSDWDLGMGRGTKSKSNEVDILFTLLPAVLYNLGTTHGLVCTLILFIWKIVRNIFCILWWDWFGMRCGWVCFKLFRLCIVLYTIFLSRGC